MANTMDKEKGTSEGVSNALEEPFLVEFALPTDDENPKDWPLLKNGPLQASCPLLASTGSWSLLS
jgi:hypothetical protein